MAETSHWIESWILRVGRRFCLFMGTLAVVAIALGSVALLIGGAWWLLGSPSKPEPLPKPEVLRPVSLEDARKNSALEQHFDDTTGESLTVRSATLQKVAPLQEIFPAPQYTWEDTYQEYCRAPSSYGCMERGKKLTRRGVSHYVAWWVQSSGGRDDEEGLALELKRVLGTAPVAERADLVVPVLKALVDRLAAQEQAEKDWDSKVSRGESDYEAAVADHRTKAGGLTMGGAASIAGGLIAALSVSLVVAILSIERHLRMNPGNPLPAPSPTAPIDS